MRSFVFFCLVAFQAVCGELQPSELYPHSMIVKSGAMRIYWKFTNSHITFELHGRTTGWLGIGFSPNGAMTGSDIAVGWVKNGEATITDRHANSNSFPPLDPKQDINILTGSECDGWTILKFSREIAACEDDFDREITQYTERLIWACGEEDPTGDDIQPWNYHRSCRGVESMYFLEPSTAPMKLPEGPVYKTFDIVMDDFPIPSNEDTYYNCMLFKLPALDKKHHITMYEPLIQKGNEQFVHHMFMYRCGNVMENKQELGKSERCYSANMQHFFSCTTVIAGWAVGGGATYYPEAAGMSIGGDGDPVYVQIEIHYDNPFYRSGILDNSGLRFTYTESLRQHDIGVIMTGVSTVGFENIIPPQVESYTTVGHCDPFCFKKSLGDQKMENITVFRTFLHSHLAGRKLRLRHFREGEELPYIADDQFYDFNYQQERPLDPFVTIGPNDYLRMECDYNTKGRANVTEFGLATRQEMCLGMLYYYPKVDLASCISSTPHQMVLLYFGVVADFSESIGASGDPADFALNAFDISKNINSTSPVTLEDYLNSFPWSSEKAKEYENFIRTTPHYSLCIPQNKWDTAFEYRNVSEIKTEYMKPERKCTPSLSELKQNIPQTECYDYSYQSSTAAVVAEEPGIGTWKIVIPFLIAGAFSGTVAAVVLLRRP